MAALSYREYPPPADLARWIACFWQIGGAVGESSGFSHRVLPDGCADLLFDLQTARRRGGVQGEIVGPMSAGRLVELRAAVDLLGIRLRPGPVIGAAVTRWARPHEVGFPNISILVRDLGLSERAFERRFVANVGLTPVRFRRLARLRAVLRLFSQGVRDWAALAAATGFSDQSHLVRDFQAFVGLSPTRWAATQAGNAGFLQDGQVTSI
jgi:AraC-like DNA-binding protein